MAAIAGLMAACGNDRKAGMQPDPSLKEAASGKFLMGVALNVRQAAGQDTCASKVVKRHFNSIVAENCMKCEVIHPEEDHLILRKRTGWFVLARRTIWLLSGIALSGIHSWHLGSVWTNKENSKCRHLEGAYKKHIQTIVTHYKGRIKGWDVLNEAIESDGSWRKSPFTRY